MRLSAAMRIDGSSDDRDRAWLARMRAGDETALTALFRAYYGLLHRFVIGITGSPDLAEEVVQDVFVAIWDRRTSLEIRTTLRSYLYAAASNRARNASRHHAVRERVEDDAFRATADHTAPAADELAHHNDLSAAMRRAITRLPAGCRDVFLLSRRDGLTTAEISAVLGVSPKAVEMRLWRALIALRRNLVGFLPRSLLGLALITLGRTLSGWM